MIIKPAKRLNNINEYYFSIKLQEIAKLRESGIDIINIGIGNPDFAPSNATIKTLIRSANNPKNHGYQSYSGLFEFKSAIANWSKKTYGTSLDPKHEILPLLGSKEGIMYISMAFINPEDKILIPDPAYPTYQGIANLIQAKTITYNLDEKNNWQINFNRLETLPLDEIKLMWINFPNMPTGAQINLADINRLVQLAKKHKFLIINDNPYSLILNPKPKSALAAKDAKDVLLELNSFSKSHNMAGWRVGWLSGKKEYIQAVLKVKSNIDSGMFKPIQEAAITALNNSKKWHNKINLKYKKRRQILWQIFDLLNCSYDKSQVGMFLWAKLPNSVKKAQDFVDDILYQANVFITPGIIFGSNANRYLRASLCSCEKDLQEAKTRILNYLGK